jgi:hypothetical protein
MRSSYNASGEVTAGDAHSIFLAVLSINEQFLNNLNQNWLRNQITSESTEQRWLI